eukprot:m.7282 g.7282  ORF g.7282 m.7282 type:complete len:99 (+) comp4994_c0_seq1:1542-1838(+)
MSLQGTLTDIEADMRSAFAFALSGHANQEPATLAANADKILQSLSMLQDQLQRAQMSRLPCDASDNTKDWNTFTNEASEKEKAADAIRQTLSELRHSL